MCIFSIQFNIRVSLFIIPIYMLQQDCLIYVSVLCVCMCLVFQKQNHIALELVAYNTHSQNFL